MDLIDVKHNLIFVAVAVMLGIESKAFCMKGKLLPLSYIPCPQGIFKAKQEKSLWESQDHRQHVDIAFLKLMCFLLNLTYFTFYALKVKE